jgi:cytosine deaminase
MMKEALQRGCDVVGSAPYCDPNPEENIKIIFDLAQEFNVMVDFHLDYHLDGKPSYLDFVIQETIARGWQHKVCLGHMTYLSTMNRQAIETISQRISEAGTHI